MEGTRKMILFNYPHDNEKTEAEQRCYMSKISQLMTSKVRLDWFSHYLEARQHPWKIAEGVLIWMDEYQFWMCVETYTEERLIFNKMLVMKPDIIPDSLISTPLPPYTPSLINITY